MIEVMGKSGIVAKEILSSVSDSGIEILTMEVTYPRIILAELNTHRMLSKNSASSRAIPFNKMVEQLTGKPVRFGKANPGMQDNGEHDASVDLNGSLCGPYMAWEVAIGSALKYSKAFHDAGYAKQIYNRFTEPFQMMKTIITATEWDNFFHLRDSDLADPTFRELARCMREVYENAKYTPLKYGQWHLPYVDKIDDVYICNSSSKEIDLTIDQAKKVSCARCAAVSFRNTDYDLEKCLQVYDRLTSLGAIHGSALEHCATPMGIYVNSWEEGISHKDRSGWLWSGNFKGWIQYRKTIPGENYSG